MNAPPSTGSRSRWVAPLLVFILGTVAYSNSFHGPFIFDDVSVSRNPQILSLNPFKHTMMGPTTIAGRPVLIFSFAVDYAIAHLKVEVYHETNLLIHLLAALALYGIVHRTLLQTKICENSAATSPIWLAALVAALWVVHPLNTQSVTYIVQRAESLASLFLLTAIYCFIRAASGSKWWGIATVIACVLGMASKEIVAAAPILALLYDRAFLAGSFKSALSRRSKLYAAMALTWIFILYSLHTGQRGNMVGFNLDISPLDYFRTELNVIARYLRLALCPTDLVFDYYDWPVARHWSDVNWQGWLVLGLMILTLIAPRGSPRLGFLGAWFFLILAPTSSFLPIKQEAAAEQRMYLPLAAVICLIVITVFAAVRRAPPARWIAGILACILIVTLTRLTLQRNDLYASAVDIWIDTVAKRPQNTRARTNLGLAWAHESLRFPLGSPESNAAAIKAAEQFQIVLDLEPRVTQVVFALGESLQRLNEPLAAEQLYTDALPRYPQIKVDLLVERGNLRASRRDWMDAKSDYLNAISSAPTNVEPHYFLGVLYQQLGDWKNAEDQFSRTLAIDSHYKDTAARMQAVRHSAENNP